MDSSIDSRRASSKRPWVLLILVAVATFVVALGVVVLIPREPKIIVLGREGSFRYTFDPHLFLEVQEATLDTAAMALNSKVIASNTAVGDLVIDLSDLRFAVELEGGEMLTPVVAEWTHAQGPAASQLPPRTKATARLSLPLPADKSLRALVIWEEHGLLERLPILRGGILDPRLRVEFDGFK